MEYDEKLENDIRRSLSKELSSRNATLRREKRSNEPESPHDEILAIWDDDLLNDI